MAYAGTPTPYSPQPYPPAQPPPRRGLTGPHAAIWVALIVVFGPVILCLLPCLLCGGFGFIGTLLPGGSPTPTP